MRLLHQRRLLLLFLGQLLLLQQRRPLPLILGQHRSVGGSTAAGRPDTACAQPVRIWLWTV